VAYVRNRNDTKRNSVCVEDVEFFIRKKHTSSPAQQYVIAYTSYTAATEL